MFDVPGSVPELVARARELEEQGHPGATACWARLRALVAEPGYTHPDDPAVGPLARLRGDLREDEAARAHARGRYDTAARLHSKAADHYEEAGLPAHAALAGARCLLAEHEALAAEGDGGGEDETTGIALGSAHTVLVHLHEHTPGLAPYQEARVLRLRATALGLRHQADRSEEHAEAALAEIGLLEEFATRHGIAGEVSGARLLRATAYATRGDLAAAVAEAGGLLDRLREHGPAWHLPHALGLRGRLRLDLRDAEAAHADLAEALRHAARWPDLALFTARLHSDLAQASLRLGRHDEALLHLTRSAELDMREGSRTDAFSTFGNAAQISFELGRVADCIALVDSLLAEPDAVSGGLDDRMLAQLRLTRARALRVGQDAKAATAEFVALAAESAEWDDDPGGHAMIAGETAVLLAEAGEFGRARAVADQALAAHAKAPRYEQLSSCLREIARLQAQQQGPDGLPGARALLADAALLADEARAAGYRAHGRSLDTALAFEYGRVNAYAGAYEEALTALEQALALLGEPSPGAAGEWAECVRLAGVVEGVHLGRPAAALARLDAATSRLTALGRTEAAEPLASLAAQLRDEG